MQSVSLQQHERRTRPAAHPCTWRGGTASVAGLSPSFAAATLAHIPPPLPVVPCRSRPPAHAVAVGGRPTKIGIPGAELCITSDEALELPDAPK
eukprot:62295-Chlamydomonas_euryale.AAC.1